MDNSKAIETITKAIDFHTKEGAKMLAHGAIYGCELSIIRGHLHEVMAESLYEARYLYGYHFLGDGSRLREMQEYSYFDKRAKAIIKSAKALSQQ
ncbi:hypothetical protein [Moellerella wisconsensis]|uniref:Uncharacterized protein n=1 Tax=Moellerella wisconsensis TaxID=158849 RepID=A0ACD3Y9U5_9GAMM|nr:hypothetical protein [Moellerella wisconsensis]UNH39937.1 hypothetical protein MNY70_05705 [Moellerella wisconsensis]